MSDVKVTYSDELFDNLCLEIASGSSVQAATNVYGITDRVFYKWLTKHEQAIHKYARAKSIRADARFESSEQLMIDLRDNKIDSAQARVMLDEIKWKTGKESAKKYGDKLAIGGADDLAPIKIEVSAKNLAAARKRILKDDDC